MNDEIEKGDIIFIDKYLYPNGEVGRNHMFIVFDKLTEEEQLPGYLLPSLESFVDMFLDIELSSKIEKAREHSDNPNHRYNLTITDEQSITNLHEETHAKVDQLYLFSKDLLNEKLKNNEIYKLGKISKKQLKKIEELMKNCILEQSHSHSFNL
ncbi:hypothetical protein KHQ81_15700 (plasmid) [Mycoplasmatota bacterium]|nr:hypothetical protein KHQ81_15700 [Mycoplasmatota bacterium]